MKKVLLAILLSFLSSNFFAETFVVLDFETDNFCLENKVASMSGLLIDELVKIEGITVLERNKLADVIKELNFKDSIYSDINSAKSIGKMLNADYVITGNTSFIGSQLVVTSRLVEVETAKIIHSAKMYCSYWFEFHNKLPKFAQDLVEKYIAKAPIVNHLLGVWQCKVGDEYYEISFNKNQTCEITIRNSEDNFVTTETIKGVYSYGKENFTKASTLKIQAGVKHLKKQIEWSGFYNFLTQDFSSFNAQLKTQGGKTIYASFVKIR